LPPWSRTKTSGRSNSVVGQRCRGVQRSGGSPRPASQMPRRSCSCTASPSTGGSGARSSLAERYRVIAPDLRGAGWTDAPRLRWIQTLLRPSGARGGLGASARTPICVSSRTCLPVPAAVVPAGRRRAQAVVVTHALDLFGRVL
jgi:hypothetical protein